MNRWLAAAEALLGRRAGEPPPPWQVQCACGRVAAGLWWFDRVIVDGTVNGIGAATRDAGGGLRRIQTGRVQNYALGIAIGLLVMAGSFLVIAGQPR